MARRPTKRKPKRPNGVVGPQKRKTAPAVAKPKYKPKVETPIITKNKAPVDYIKHIQFKSSHKPNTFQTSHSIVQGYTRPDVSVPKKITPNKVLIDTQRKRAERKEREKHQKDFEKRLTISATLGTPPDLDLFMHPAILSNTKYSESNYNLLINLQKYQMGFTDINGNSTDPTEELQYRKDAQKAILEDIPKSFNSIAELQEWYETMSKTYHVPSAYPGGVSQVIPVMQEDKCPREVDQKLWKKMCEQSEETYIKALKENRELKKQYLMTSNLNSTDDETIFYALRNTIHDTMKGAPVLESLQTHLGEFIAFKVMLPIQEKEWRTLALNSFSWLVDSFDTLTGARHIKAITVPAVNMDNPDAYNAPTYKSVNKKELKQILAHGGRKLIAGLSTGDSGNPGRLGGYTSDIKEKKLKEGWAELKKYDYDLYLKAKEWFKEYKEIRKEYGDESFDRFKRSFVSNENYQYDTGNTVIDFTLEMMSDPTFVLSAGTGVAKTAGKSALKKGLRPGVEKAFTNLMNPEVLLRSKTLSDTTKDFYKVTGGFDDFSYTLNKDVKKFFRQVTRDPKINKYKAIDEYVEAFVESRFTKPKSNIFPEQVINTAKEDTKLYLKRSLKSVVSTKQLDQGWEILESLHKANALTNWIDTKVTQGVFLPMVGGWKLFKLGKSKVSYWNAQRARRFGDNKKIDLDMNNGYTTMTSPLTLDDKIKKALELAEESKVVGTDTEISKTLATQVNKGLTSELNILIEAILKFEKLNIDGKYSLEEFKEYTDDIIKSFGNPKIASNFEDYLKYLNTTTHRMIWTSDNLKNINAVQVQYKNVEAALEIAKESNKPVSDLIEKDVVYSGDFFLEYFYKRQNEKKITVAQTHSVRQVFKQLFKQNGFNKNSVEYQEFFKIFDDLTETVETVNYKTRKMNKTELENRVYKKYNTKAKQDLADVLQKSKFDINDKLEKIYQKPILSEVAYNNIKNILSGWIRAFWEYPIFVKGIGTMKLVNTPKGLKLVQVDFDMEKILADLSEILGDYYNVLYSRKDYVKIREQIEEILERASIDKANIIKIMELLEDPRNITTASGKLLDLLDPVHPAVSQKVFQEVSGLRQAYINSPNDRFILRKRILKVLEDGGVPEYKIRTFITNIINPESIKILSKARSINRPYLTDLTFDKLEKLLTKYQKLFNASPERPRLRKRVTAYFKELGTDEKAINEFIKVAENPNLTTEQLYKAVSKLEPEATPIYSMDSIIGFLKKLPVYTQGRADIIRILNQENLSPAQRTKFLKLALDPMNISQNLKKLKKSTIAIEQETLEEIEKAIFGSNLASESGSNANSASKLNGNSAKVPDPIDDKKKLIEEYEEIVDYSFYDRMTDVLRVMSKYQPKLKGNKKVFKKLASKDSKEKLSTVREMLESYHAEYLAEDLLNILDTLENCVRNDYRNKGFQVSIYDQMLSFRSKIAGKINSLLKSRNIKLEEGWYRYKDTLYKKPKTPDITLATRLSEILQVDLPENSNTGQAIMEYFKAFRDSPTKMNTLKINEVAEIFKEIFRFQGADPKVVKTFFKLFDDITETKVIFRGPAEVRVKISSGLKSENISEYKIFKVLENVGVKDSKYFTPTYPKDDELLFYDELCAYLDTEFFSKIEKENIFPIGHSWMNAKIKTQHVIETYLRNTEFKRLYHGLFKKDYTKKDGVADQLGYMVTNRDKLNDPKLRATLDDSQIAVLDDLKHLLDDIYYQFLGVDDYHNFVHLLRTNYPNVFDATDIQIIENVFPNFQRANFEDMTSPDKNPALAAAFANKVEASMYFNKGDKLSLSLDTLALDIQNSESPLYKELGATPEDIKAAQKAFKKLEKDYGPQHLNPMFDVIIQDVFIRKYCAQQIKEILKKNPKARIQLHDWETSSTSPRSTTVRSVAVKDLNLDDFDETDTIAQMIEKARANAKQGKVIEVKYHRTDPAIVEIGFDEGTNPEVMGNLTDAQFKARYMTNDPNATLSPDELMTQYDKILDNCVQNNITIITHSLSGFDMQLIKTNTKLGADFAKIRKNSMNSLTLALPENCRLDQKKRNALEDILRNRKTYGSSGETKFFSPDKCMRTLNNFIKSLSESKLVTSENTIVMDNIISATHYKILNEVFDIDEGVDFLDKLRVLVSRVEDYVDDSRRYNKLLQRELLLNPDEITEAYIKTQNRELYDLFRLSYVNTHYKGTSQIYKDKFFREAALIYIAGGKSVFEAGQEVLDDFIKARFGRQINIINALEGSNLMPKYVIKMEDIKNFGQPGIKQMSVKDTYSYTHLQRYVDRLLSKEIRLKNELTKKHDALGKFIEEFVEKSNKVPKTMIPPNSTHSRYGMALWLISQDFEVLTNNKTLAQKARGLHLEDHRLETAYSIDPDDPRSLVNAGNTELLFGDNHRVSNLIRTTDQSLESLRVMAMVFDNEKLFTEHTWAIANCMGDYRDLLEIMIKLPKKEQKKIFTKVRNNLEINKTRSVMKFLTIQDPSNIAPFGSKLKQLLLWQSGLLIVPNKSGIEDIERFHQKLNKYRIDHPDSPIKVMRPHGDNYTYIFIDKNKRHGATLDKQHRVFMDEPNVKYSRPILKDVELHPDALGGKYKDVIEATNKVLKGIKKYSAEYDLVKKDMYITSRSSGSAYNMLTRDQFKTYVYDRLPYEVKQAYGEFENSSTNMDFEQFFDTVRVGEVETQFNIPKDSHLLMSLNNTLYRTLNDAKAEVVLVDSWFNTQDNFSIKQFVDEVNDPKEIIKFFKNEPGWAVVSLESKKNGYVVRQHKLENKTDIKTAIARNAVVMPYATFSKTFKSVTRPVYDSQFLKIWSGLVQLTKIGYLASPGTIVRNLVDSLLKASMDTERPDRIVVNTIKAAKLTWQYNQAINYLAKLNKGNTFDIRQAGYMYDQIAHMTDLTKDQFLELYGIFQQGSSNEARSILRIMKKEAEEHATKQNLSDYTGFHVVGQRDNLLLQVPEATLEDFFNTIEHPPGFTFKNFMEFLNKQYTGKLGYDECSEVVSRMYASMLEHGVEHPKTFSDYLETFSNAVLTPTNVVENSVRLGHYLTLAEQGVGRNTALSRVANTHFDYDLKTVGTKYGELVLPFANFTKLNIEFWAEMLSAHPNWMKALTEFFNVASWDFANRTPEELIYDESLKYHMLSGNISINDDIRLKLNPSMLDAYNTIANPATQLLDKLWAPGKAAMGFGLYHTGLCNSMLFDKTVAWGYEEGFTAEDVTQLFPFGNWIHRYTSMSPEARQRAHDLGYNENSSWDEIVAAFPDVFGVEKSRYAGSNSLTSDSFEGFQNNLKQQGKWFDSNTGEVKSLNEKNYAGLNNPKYNVFDNSRAKKVTAAYKAQIIAWKMIGFTPGKKERDALRIHLNRRFYDPAEKEYTGTLMNSLEVDMFLTKGKVWDANSQSFVPFSEFRLVGLNLDYGDDFEAYNKARRKWRGEVYDANLRKYVKIGHQTEGGLNRTDLSWDEVKFYRELYHDEVWDANVKKFVPAEEYSGDVMLNKPNLSWPEVCQYNAELFGLEWDSNTKNWVELGKSTSGHYVAGKGYVWNNRNAENSYTKYRSEFYGGYRVQGISPKPSIITSTLPKRKTTVKSAGRTYTVSDGNYTGLKMATDSSYQYVPVARATHYGFPTRRRKFENDYKATQLIRERRLSAKYGIHTYQNLAGLSTEQKIARIKSMYWFVQ